MREYLPSPSQGVWHLGPVPIRAYAVCLIAGIFVAVLVTRRRWVARGRDADDVSAIATWAVPFGIVGGRLYHVITDPELYFKKGEHPIQALYIWRGGLGIWGGVAGGVATGLIGARRMGLPFRPLVDCVAVAFPLAQAIGRWGNYFNQELFGWASKLPWAVEISPANRPPGYTQYSTFQPTFLYECVWDLLVVVLLMGAERRFRVRRGYLIAVYAALYTFGRFFTEYMRIDDAHRFWGLRLNDWTSIVVFTASVAVLTLRGRAAPGDDRAGDPLPGPAGDASLPGTQPAVAGQAS